MSTLKQLLREAGLDEETCKALIEQAEAEKQGAVTEAVEKAKEDHMTFEDYEYAKECELEARAHEADSVRLYGDYHEEMGLLGSGKGILYTNDAGEPLGWT